MTKEQALKAVNISKEIDRLYREQREIIVNCDDSNRHPQIHACSYDDFTELAEALGVTAEMIEDRYLPAYDYHERYFMYEGVKILCLLH